jgi:hypothetical protein
LIKKVYRSTHKAVALPKLLRPHLRVRCRRDG